VDDRATTIVADAGDHLRRTGRPLVTLSYAQTLDGSLTLTRGTPSPVSGEESLRATHRLRAAHDAILIGSGTLLSDDPRLSVRLVEGASPRPIVLDSHLRFPLTARMLAEGPEPWVAALDGASASRRAALEAAGARVLYLPADPAGRVSLPHLLARLGQEGITSLMVEGGAAVITSFLRERLANRAAITLAPVFAGGLRAVGPLGAAAWGSLPRFANARWDAVGRDCMVWGNIVYGENA
jgi:GTP cyclohydrolase II